MFNWEIFIVGQIAGKTQGNSCPLPLIDVDVRLQLQLYSWLNSTTVFTAWSNSTIKLQLKKNFIAIDQVIALVNFDHAVFTAWQNLTSSQLQCTLLYLPYLPIAMNWSKSTMLYIKRCKYSMSNSTKRDQFRNAINMPLTLSVQKIEPFSTF